MRSTTKRHIIASIGTAIFMLLIFLLLWFIYLTAVVPEEEEGIEIAFGEVVEEEPERPVLSDAAYAEESYDAAPAIPAAPAEVVATDPTPSSPQEHIMSEEETLALALAKKQKEEREAAERARKQKEAEAAQKANNLINNLGFGKANGTNTTGDGGGKEAGPKGNPIASGGSSRDGRIKGLNGRSPRDGKLPEPTCEFQHYGVVVVQIKIDKDGNNIYAVNAAGTNTSDQQMIQCAINAIKKTKWTAGDGEAVGTITYTFNVK